MKIMILSQTPPSLQCTAGITLDGICQQLKPHLVCNAVLLNPRQAYLKNNTSIDIPYLFLPKPIESGIPIPPQLSSLDKPLRPLRDTASWLLYRYQMRAFPKLIKKITAFASQHNIDSIVANLDTPGPILTALAVAKNLQLPLYTMVFDPPEWHMTAYNMAPATIRYVKKVFDETVASSTCCAVIAQPMADEYKKLYGVATQVIQHSLPESMGQPCQSTLSDKEHLYIGMAGQLYAREAWESLLAMLGANNWTIAGRKVIIRYMGRGPLSPSNEPQHIEWLGWRDQRDAVRLLAECDVLYCPYPFKPEEKDVARLSFPSKITLYLAAARPILFHGPAYSSPVEFFIRTQSGFSVTEVAGEGLQKSLERLINEPDLYASMCQNAYTVFRNEFTSSAMRKNILRFLALDAE
ncbi:hypothetical protein [Desulfovibrio cuneatus]|uniref:hypothetical protein n=1 Tax=Desulfovibrio cuneatus TaxID=159728 RepID=UPI0004013C5C|nr:hypothetical protein [Desulfovibrio cuneatus]